MSAWSDGSAIAASVRGRLVRAGEVVEAALERIGSQDGAINAFTAVLAERAKTEAREVDAAIAAGRSTGPLAGVPYAVKNLFDIDGLTTLAGAGINRENSAATADAAVVRAMRAAGAVLVGAVNMDEYAYGFTTENAHYGPTRNPHDRRRSAGGSSGGSAAAVAAGMVPIALGTDTGGSVRVPASFCGLFGLKPTFGRVSRAGSVLFSPSVDHVGPLARTVADLAAVFDAVQGPDANDPSCSSVPASPVSPFLASGIGDLRIAVANGYFLEAAEAETIAAVLEVAKAAGVSRRVEVPNAAAGRAVATIVTAVEGASLRLNDLRRRPADFDPMTRDRFIAGGLLPGSIYVRAQARRARFREDMRALFRDVDVLIAPVTPAAPPLIGQDLVMIDGVTYPSRGHIGRFTIPFSIAGLPAMSVPARVGGLPRGVQLIAAPFKEGHLFRLAAHLERLGAVGFTPPK